MRRPESDPICQTAAKMPRVWPLSRRIISLLRIHPLGPEELSELLVEPVKEIQAEALMMLMDKQIFKVRSWLPGRPVRYVTTARGFNL